MPLVVPLLVCLLMCLPMMLSEGHLDDGSVLFVVYGVFGWSLIFGGIPYLLFYLYSGYWMRNKTLGEVARRIKLAPLYFIPCQLIFLLLPVLVFYWHDMGKIHYGYLFFGGLSIAFILVLGYFYVGVALGVMALLRRRHVIADKAD